MATLTTRPRPTEIMTRRQEPASNSIRNLARYRSYLRIRARNIAPDLRAKIDSSDVVQQTLLEAFENMHQFSGETTSEMEAWLGRMLNNNMTDAARMLRRKKRDVSREKPLEAERSKFVHGAGDRIKSDQTTPSLCAIRSEDLIQLHQILSSLPEKQREVIILHHLQGKSLAETARKIDRSETAVAGLLYRGLKTLRSKLAD